MEITKFKKGAVTIIWYMTSFLLTFLVVTTLYRVYVYDSNKSVYNMLYWAMMMIAIGWGGLVTMTILGFLQLVWRMRDKVE